jgi:hypothetical protein
VDVALALRVSAVRRKAIPGLGAAEGVEVTGVWEGCPGKELDLSQSEKRERLSLTLGGGAPGSEPALLPGFALIWLGS